MLDIPTEDNQTTEPTQPSPALSNPSSGPAGDIKSSQIKVENRNKKEEKEEIQIPKNTQDKEEAIIEPGIEIEGSIDKKINYSLIFTILATMIILGTSGFFYYQKTVKAAKIEIKKMEIAEVDDQLSAKDIQKTEERANSLSEGIKKLEEAFKDQVLWTELFSDLSQNTLQAVSFKSFSTDNQGNVKIAGVTDKYGNAAKLMVGLKQSEKVKKVELANLGITEEKEEETENTKTLVEFSLDLEYDLKLLSPEDKEGQEDKEGDKIKEEIQPEVQSIE